jgi:indole-3-glycerol phosphate synthase
LKTFEINLRTTEELAAFIPNDYLIVSESGFNNISDLNRMKRINIKSFLIGESLMRQSNIKKATEDLLKSN